MNGSFARLAVLMRAGRFLAVGVIGAGALGMMLLPDASRADRDLLGQLAAGGPGSVVMAGLMVLALTPITVLAGAAATFIRLGERRSAAAASAALGLLLAGLVAGALTGLGGG